MDEKVSKFDKFFGFFPAAYVNLNLNTKEKIIRIHSKTTYILTRKHQI